MKHGNNLAMSYAADLTTIKRAEAAAAAHMADDDEEIHVQTPGASLTELYESIRNASQYSEENLQLTHAIERFLERLFYLSSSHKVDKSGNKLISELTMGGYLANDSIKQSMADHITNIIKTSVTLKKHLQHHYSRHQITSWVIRPLSVRIESLLCSHSKDQALTNLAFNYFLSAIDIDEISGGNRPAAYESLLYMAVQRALLGSEDASIRLSLLDRYSVSAAKYSEYAKFNQQIDDAFASKYFDILTKIVSRHGAVFRIINRTAAIDDGLDQHITTEKTFLGPFDTAIQKTYLNVNHHINRGIIRSVLFLIITKFIIGIAIELPYDIIVHGEVKWLPLGVNLLLPPLYMILLRLTLTMPDTRNTKALHREASRILFKPIAKNPFIEYRPRQFSKVYNFIYSLLVIGVFAGASWLLMAFAKFEWIHLLIFFVFISTASFLGFRLSRAIRKIEVGDEAQTTASILRDFLYMPFVVVGQKINETYAKINIVSRLLDMFVELPLKTIIGLLRRWGNFMSARRDEL